MSNVARKSSVPFGKLSPSSDRSTSPAATTLAGDDEAPRMATSAPAQDSSPSPPRRANPVVGKMPTAPPPKSNALPRSPSGARGGRAFAKMTTGPARMDGAAKARARQAERDIEMYGGDDPRPPNKDRRGTFSGIGPLRPTERLIRQHSVYRTASPTGPPPDLYVTDPAFQECHVARARTASRTSSTRSGARVARQRTAGTVTSAGAISDAAVPEEDEEEVEEEEPEHPDEAVRADPNKVVWAENDPENPQNWSKARKWGITLLGALLTVNVTFASSAPSAGTEIISEEFGCSTEVGALITSLFLCGYILGPLLWAPSSEMFGRRPVFLVSMGVYVIFQIGCALAKNMGTILVCRFLAGTFAASPLTNAGGLIADTWDAVGRGIAMTVFTTSVFVGPVLGPVIANFVVQSYLGWRWVFWLIMIWGGAAWVVCLVFLPETFSPVLLAKRAKRLRKEDPEKNKDLYAEQERADFSPKAIVTRTLLRPFVMLFTEPVLAAITLYLSVVYGLLYGCFSAFPLIFERVHGLSPQHGGLIFLGVGIGVLAGALINLRLQRHYRHLVPKWHGFPPCEERLPGSIVAGPLLVVGLFWLGWSGYYPAVPWYVPALATICLGAAFVLVFISFLSFLIEVYMYSASALAANTIVRSAFGAAFPLFTTQMYTNLGVNWAASLLGFVALALSPIPLVFYLYGHHLRNSSKWAPALDLKMAPMVEKEEDEEDERVRVHEGAFEHWKRSQNPDAHYHAHRHHPDAPHHAPTDAEKAADGNAAPAEPTKEGAPPAPAAAGDSTTAADDEKAATKGTKPAEEGVDGAKGANGAATQ